MLVLFVYGRHLDFKTEFDKGDKDILLLIVMNELSSSPAHVGEP